MNERRPLDTGAVATMVLLTSIWGFTQVAIKLAAADVSVVMQGGLRSIISLVLLFGWARWRGVALFERDATWWPGLLAGALYAGEFFFVYAGLAHTSASRMVVFVYLAPALTAIGVHLFVAGEQLAGRQWIGIVLAFAGVAVAFGDGFAASPASSLGDAFGIVAAFLWAATTVVIRMSALSQASASKTLFYQIAVAALVLLFVWRAALWPLVLLVWGIALLAFASFPLYARRLNVKHDRVGLVFFDFGRGGIQLILWGLCVLVLVALALLSDSFGWGDVLRWGVATLVLVVIVSIDLSGSTPVLKSGLQGDRLLRVRLDTDKCKGAGACEQVCPRNCFEVDRQEHTATMPGAERCVQCGACIVQCPFDALAFADPTGGVIPPETIRRFKLNMMGERRRSGMEERQHPTRR